jgi:hypothetical protein
MSQLGSPSVRGQWFDPAIAAVLGQAHVVLEAQHPRALERITSQLIGDQLHQVLVAKKSGMWFDRWFAELVSPPSPGCASRPTAALGRHRFGCCTAWPRSAPPMRRSQRSRPPTDCASS